MKLKAGFTHEKRPTKMVALSGRKGGTQIGKRVKSGARLIPQEKKPTQRDLLRTKRKRSMTVGRGNTKEWVEEGPGPIKWGGSGWILEVPWKTSKGGEEKRKGTLILVTGIGGNCCRAY